MKKSILLILALLWAVGSTAQLTVKENEATVAERTIMLRCFQTDGITIATGEAGGQPSVMTSTATTATTTGIGVLGTHAGFGMYPAVLTQTLVNTSGNGIWAAYKDTDTANCYSVPPSVQVVGYDPYNAANLALTGLPSAAPGGAGGMPIMGTNAVTWPKGVAYSDLKFVMYNAATNTKMITGTVGCRISKGSGAEANCTNAATIAQVSGTTVGVWRLPSLTSTEMDADSIHVTFTLTVGANVARDVDFEFRTQH